MKPRREPDFEGSADMRLVDLQRAALGVPAPERGDWESSLGSEGGPVPDKADEEAEAAQAASAMGSAVVECDLTATPSSGVIPGAIVTLAASIANEGAVPARNVRVTVPLPGGASYRNGSLTRDGRPSSDEAAEELFTTGTLLPQIAPKTRVTFLWKIGVRLGNKPLVIAPTILAENTAVIGAEPLLVSRKEGAQSTFTSQVAHADPALYPPEPKDLPIYELDEEEIIEHEAADAALSGIAEYRPPMEPPVAPSTPPPDQPEPLPPPDQPAPVEEPGVPVVEPSMPEPPEQPPDIEPAAREAVLLTGQIDRPSIAYFDRIFNGSKPPALLNHFILGGALACTRTAHGDDIAGLKAHLDAQAQLLQRIVLHEKLGKKEPIAEYAGSILARVDQLVPQTVPAIAPPADKNVVLLYAELDTPTLGVLTKMQEDPARWDFTKARQMTLALQARSASANAPEAAIENAGAALRAYAQTASMQLQRFFVRMRIDRTTGLLFANDETLDAAARTLIAALIALF